MLGGQMGKNKTRTIGKRHCYRFSTSTLQSQRDWCWGLMKQVVRARKTSEVTSTALRSSVKTCHWLGGVFLHPSPHLIAQCSLEPCAQSQQPFTMEPHSHYACGGQGDRLHQEEKGEEHEKACIWAHGGELPEPSRRISEVKLNSTGIHMALRATRMWHWCNLCAARSGQGHGVHTQNPDSNICRNSETINVKKHLQTWYLHRISSEGLI